MAADAGDLRFVHFGAGAQNVNSGSGEQTNFIQNEGSNNRQFNARAIYYNENNALDQSDQQRTACRNALFLTDPEIDRANLISTKGKRVDGTCTWIENNDAYKSWLRGDTHLLWICGGPGKGKTMLSIFLTQELERDKRAIYYFCSSEDEKRNNAAAVLRGLLWHITAKDRELTQYLLQYLDTPERSQAVLSSPETLWSILLRLFRDPSLDSTFCVLDGLDECDEDSRQWFVRKLADFNSTQSPESSKSALRLVIVSRDIPGLRKCQQLRLDPDNDDQVSTDLGAYVSVKVQELSELIGFTEEFRIRVEDALLERAEGTFLWVGFAMTELLRKKTASEVEAAIHSFPRGLSAVYSRMLLQIEPSHRAASARMLQWVTMTARPLSLQELADAVGCRSLGPIGREQAIYDQITICKPFLRVHDQKVGFVHQSAKDYLVREKVDANAVLEEFRIKPEQAHLQIAQTCIDSISRSSLQSSVLSTDESVQTVSHQADPLLNYALYHWPEHARLSSKFVQQLLECSKSFFNQKSVLRDNWWRSCGTRYDMPPLHMACYLGIVPWAQVLLRQKRSMISFRKRLNERNPQGRTPLWYAAQGGHEAMVRELLDSGADINPGYTPLFSAASYGHEAIVRLLLDRGADANANDKTDRTALFSAASYGHEAIVRLLLDRGANVNAKDKTGHTALYGAARGGHEMVVRLLFDRGANANIKNKLVGKTALELAAA